MKKWQGTVLAFLTVLAVLLMQVAWPDEASAAATEGRIMGSNVKFRAEPNIDCPILYIFNMDTKVSILGETNGWFFISYGLIRGYVREDLVYSQTEKGRKGYILVDKAPIYSQPGEGSTVLTTDTTAGTPGRIIGFEQGYYHLTAGGVEGYMPKENVMLGSDYKEGPQTAILLKGMKGQEVFKLQQKLKSRGFYDGPVTGEFGELTQKGVREFQ
ncbi:MAG: peptidoglycan-binding protein, partial [Bacillota bacterium]|nr:peptidoglycan-binding protein [Bacillota bacterium]